VYPIQKPLVSIEEVNVVIHPRLNAVLLKEEELDSESQTC
jgi:hypothetical protein